MGGGLLSTSTGTSGLGFAALNISDWLHTSCILFEPPNKPLCIHTSTWKDCNQKTDQCQGWRPGLACSINFFCLFIRKWTNLPNFHVYSDHSGNSRLKWQMPLDHMAVRRLLLFFLVFYWLCSTQVWNQPRFFTFKSLNVLLNQRVILHICNYTNSTLLCFA